MNEFAEIFKPQNRFNASSMLRIKLPVAYGSLQLDPQQHIQKRTIRMVPTPDNSECSRQKIMAQPSIFTENSVKFSDQNNMRA
jgi:hypothetical protein